MKTLPKTLRFIEPNTDNFFEVPVIKVLNGFKYRELVKNEAKFEQVKDKTNGIYTAIKSESFDKTAYLDNIIKNLKEQKFTEEQITSTIKFYGDLVDGIKSDKIKEEDLKAIFELGQTDILSNEIDIVKMFIDEKQITTEVQEKMNVEDFWMYQDTTYIQEMSDFFRLLLHNKK